MTAPCLLALSVLLTQSPAPPAAVRAAPTVELNWNKRDVYLTALSSEFMIAGVLGLGGYLVLQPWRSPVAGWQWALPLGLGWAGAVLGATVPVWILGGLANGHGDLWRTLLYAAGVALLIPAMAGAIYLGLMLGDFIVIPLVAGLFGVLAIAGVPSVAMGTYAESHAEEVKRSANKLKLRLAPGGVVAVF